MSRTDVLRVLFDSCHYEAVLTAPQPLDWAAAGALLRVRSLTELQRYADALLEADAHLARVPRSGDLLAAKARAVMWLDGPADEIAALNAAAVAAGSARGLLNLAWLAMEDEHVAEAERLLASLGAPADPDVASIKRLYSLRNAAARLDAEDYARQRAALDVSLTHESSLHRWAWSKLFAAQADSLVGDWSAARAGLVEAKLVIRCTPPSALHVSVDAVESSLASAETRLAIWPADDERHVAEPRASATARELGRKPVLGLLYRCIDRAGAAGVTKEQIVWDVWGVSYDPVRHDERLYKSLSRLRRSLPGDGAERLVGVGDRWVLERG